MPLKTSIIRTGDDVTTNDLAYITENLKIELSAIAGKKLLITGGAGFLGYYLIQTALYWNRSFGKKRAAQITVYDNYMRGFPQWLKNLKESDGLKLVKHDISKPLPGDMEDFQFIIHAASFASPVFYRKHPIETMDANVNGLRLLLDYCQRQKDKGKPVKSFLFFSSSEIYGDPTDDNIPTPETYRGNVSCTGHRACYDESKRYAETLCVNFARKYNLPIKIVRPFNNYGPGMRISDGRVIADFARDILSGRDIIMFSDGAPSRTFCYIADAIIGYYKVLVKGRNGEAYNIGVERPEVSISDLAMLLAVLAKEIFDYGGRVIHQVSKDKNYLIDNPSRRCPIIDKAKTELGYRPSISLEEGVRRSLIWYSKNREE